MSTQADKIIRAAIYARCSTNRQDVQGQIDDLQRIAERRGWEITDIYADTAVSGSTRNRPQLDRLMRHAREGRFDLVATQRFDRAGRSLRHLITMLEEFDSLGIGFFSAFESLDTGTPSGRLLFSVIGSLAEFERSLLAERVKNGVARARREGKQLGRPERTDLDLARVRRLMKNGTSQAEIARMLEVPRTTIRSALQRADEKRVARTATACSKSS